MHCLVYFFTFIYVIIFNHIVLDLFLKKLLLSMMILKDFLIKYCLFGCIHVQVCAGMCMRFCEWKCVGKKGSKGMVRGDHKRDVYWNMYHMMFTGMICYLTFSRVIYRFYIVFWSSLTCSTFKICDYHVYQCYAVSTPF